MIPYRIGFIFRLSGSVWPRAAAWALPAAALAALLSGLKYQLGWERELASGWLTALSGFASALGLVVVFRSHQAWNRYWEGAKLVQRVRGRWCNAASSLVAFCSRKPEDSARVERFQRLVVRLLSLLYGTALSSLSGSSFEVINQDGLAESSLAFMENASDDPREVKCEVILHWLQRSVVEGIDAGVLPIAPPILAGVFSDLSAGVVDLASARTISELPLPFHFAQMLSGLLLIYTLGASVAAGDIFETWWGAGGCTFLNVFALWGINYVASEIEAPFGEGLNHLSLRAEMRRMNSLLLVALERDAQTPAEYDEGLESDARGSHPAPPRASAEALEALRTRRAVVTRKASLDPETFRTSDRSSRQACDSGPKSSEAAPVVARVPPPAAPLVEDPPLPPGSPPDDLEQLFPKRSGARSPTVSWADGQSTLLRADEAADDTGATLLTPCRGLAAAKSTMSSPTSAVAAGGQSRADMAGLGRVDESVEEVESDESGSDWHLAAGAAVPEERADLRGAADVQAAAAAARRPPRAQSAGASRRDARGALAGGAAVGGSGRRQQKVAHDSDDDDYDYSEPPGGGRHTPEFWPPFQHPHTPAWRRPQTAPAQGSRGQGRKEGGGRRGGRRGIPFGGSRRSSETLV